MLSDIEIAQNAKMLKIKDIAKELGIDEEELIPYGHYKAKISQECIDRLESKEDGKLILVTAINPTPAGEGKTTTSVGLAEGMYKIGKKAVLALREPSLGPVFGIKGGAAGGGYAQVVPMEDINLHFTGDMHAITSANNLLCALIDNHIQQGNVLGIDPRRIQIKRCLDMNDRALRNCIIGLGGKVNGVPREDHFQITVASEIMAILCLADDLVDLKARLGRILVAYTYDGKPVFASDVEAVGAMTALLKDAINPNLVQTLENTPAIIHGGPFANIAHGCNSVRATKLALKLGDYAITEAGFGSDLGAEKFFDIKCRYAGLKPSCTVIVATIRALKYNGGVPKAELNGENLEALEKGMPNLLKHVSNITNVYKLPCVVAINAFPTDTKAELDLVEAKCKELGVNVALSEVWAKGGEGAENLARLVSKVAEQCTCSMKPLYDWEWSVEKKIETIAKELYGAAAIDYTTEAKSDLKKVMDLGLDKLPVCIAKTQKSLSDNPKLLGRPKDFVVTVRQIEIASGAGFIIPITGSIMRMPGLPDIPAAEKIDIDNNGKITGLF